MWHSYLNNNGIRCLCIKLLSTLIDTNILIICVAYIYQLCTQFQTWTHTSYNQPASTVMLSNKWLCVHSTPGHHSAGNGSVPECLLPQGEAEGLDDGESRRPRTQVVCQLLQHGHQVSLTILHLRGKGGIVFF